ncbi:hypothetical protein DBR47_08900 [Paucibacter sp. KBW04]|uniref:hypothetical protein n=1 Tax=Paucibacter sp. KBW04 TaxID=2153361 RepID=UPI000F573CFA|nr:hypothetical protein [Paucibacter sp. KBW04]RQO60467.1 hypothetical protein DBR47_08900 [Paucibacter sp. KBW04]
MTEQSTPAAAWLSKHWFLPLAGLIVAGDLSAARLGDWQGSQLLEAALLFDLALLLPALYWVCYRHQGKPALLKAIGLACLGIWLCGKAIPAEQQQFLPALTWLRYLGLAGLLALELKLALALYKAVVLKGQSRQEAETQMVGEGMPPWVARLMAFEASLWRKVWMRLRRLGQKRRG